MNPLVSVILPVYNGEQYLRLAVDSVLHQDFTDFELLLIDDHSSDNTPAICHEYAEADQRVVYIRNAANKRVAATLNVGIDAAKGKYIARMDADDIALPARLGTQVSFLEQHPDITLIDTWMTYINEQNLPTGFHNAKVFEPKEIRRKLARGNVLGHSSIMIRTEVLKQHRYHKTTYEDYELWLRLTAKGYWFQKLQESLLYYRIHTESITSQANTDKSHFRKQAEAKASFLRHELRGFHWGWFQTRVTVSMLRDYFLYFYKKAKR
ncbi:MAG: hypothetical protein ABS85_03635 [Sphingobacteriales bacterium SCN 48-20]|jgi:glycosyltransferase involved in cell wall biosynthesis|uniref:glycosyltransferase family 2 protein n=1 Tax=Terrimonas ferruginea TaxID=249 RepID=UPI00086F4E8F|nr:glycosyltransferase family 2 protein [Terrimonas ferruginea]MBN8784012.1 glycosyltransferase family 2 protein [Terrimonas ferruginea]ODT94165.1 MAG: hypothetical protein ABS85_03635 [Sphingobacteriales bacterium SCN 48-20]OJW41683.1 MAG: hypothetical protein BGO56_17660 [Sphingobacteriales bacterium 48-107]